MKFYKTPLQRKRIAQGGWAKVARAVGRSSLFRSAGMARRARNANTMNRVRNYARAYRYGRGRGFKVFKRRSIFGKRFR